MQVFKQGGIFKASRISGPKHNYLGLGFSSEEATVRIVERQVGDQAERPSSFDAQAIAQLVQEAVRSEAASQNRSVYVSVIELVSTDTPDSQAYADLATEITRFALQDADHQVARSD